MNERASEQLFTYLCVCLILTLPLMGACVNLLANSTGCVVCAVMSNTRFFAVVLVCFILLTLTGIAIANIQAIARSEKSCNFSCFCVFCYGVVVACVVSERANFIYYYIFSSSSSIAFVKRASDAILVAEKSWGVKRGKNNNNIISKVDTTNKLFSIIIFS